MSCTFKTQDMVEDQLEAEALLYLNFENSECKITGTIKGPLFPFCDLKSLLEHGSFFLIRFFEDWNGLFREAYHYGILVLNQWDHPASVGSITFDPSFCKFFF